MAEKVIVKSYDPGWVEAFTEEAPRIAEALGDAVVDIEHVGSTAVPGLTAKPVVDVLVAIDPFELTHHQVDAMEKLGYEYLGEHGLPGRLCFRKEPRTHHVHVVAVDSERAEEYRLLRDYLRDHPEVATEYGELKRRLALRFRFEGDAYTQAKVPFLARTLEAAREWQSVR